MRLRCPHCGEFGTIRTSEQVTECLTLQYVQCNNMECGHNWRASTSAEMTLSPSAIPNPAVHLPLSSHIKGGLLSEQLGKPRAVYRPSSAVTSDLFEGAGPS